MENSLADFAAMLPRSKVAITSLQTANSRRHQVCWQMLRLDQLDGELSGNKLFKLLPHLLAARRHGVASVLSFGGMHSNHLHALAAAGRRFGFATIGVVRGYAAQAVTPTLADLRVMGMRIHFADREEYACRYQADYCRQLAQQYGAWVIGEGGAGQPGRDGAAWIADVIDNSMAVRPDIITVAAGTGTTFAGLLQAMPRQAVWAFAMAGNARELQALAGAVAGNNHWQVFDDGGRFGRINPVLASFMHEFEQQQGVLLDPVYTARLCQAVDSRIGRGEIAPGSHVLSLHTGGLQGRRALQDKIRRLAAAYQHEVMYECA